MSIPAGAVLDCSSQTTTLPRPFDLGVSGGNINSFGKNNQGRFCFSGTLGSMVKDTSNNQYILSNNHVLADTNKAKRGEPIVQPGLVDTNPVCQQIEGDAVATFSRTVKIKFGNHRNTIDAAIALVNPGDVNPQIVNIGSIAGTTVEPSLGLPVQKMGRSTCLTTASISTVAANGTVNYGGGKNAKFINQIVINSSGFSGPGDSGSLILTQDSCPQAVGLLFAGSADGSVTVANPILAVLSGLKVSMVGGCTAAAAAPVAASSNVEAANAGMSKEVVASATAVRDRHEDDLMSIPGAVGTGIGAGDQPGQPAIVVYVKKMTAEAQAAAPKEVEGVPVKLIENGGFVAY